MKCLCDRSVFVLIAAAALAGCAPNQASQPRSGVRSALLTTGTGTETTVDTQSTVPTDSTADPESWRRLVILGTNDIHGSIEPMPNKNGIGTKGGMAFLSGAAQAIRDGIKARFGDRAGVLLLDAGDQFQGTLIANYSEGRVVFSAMNAAGYDAVVPGNHDYDFGPWGWLTDQLEPGKTGDPKAVIRDLAKSVKFPLLSANTYLIPSLKDTEGKPVNVTQRNCTVERGSRQKIDWSVAKRPEFLKPYIIKTVARDLRVAIIGLDHIDTATMTTPANVSDLCFRDTVAAYDEIRDSLEGKAEIFVLVQHNGVEDSKDFISAVLAKGGDRLHAVIAGHTHRAEKAEIGGVPLIQSMANGDAFGRIDLIWDTATRKVVSGQKVILSALIMDHAACTPGMDTFCKAEDKGVLYEGQRVRLNEQIRGLIRDWRAKIAPLAQKPVGKASAEVVRHRFLESPLGNILSDAIRGVSGADVSLINTGGIRANIPAGTVTYEQFYSVLPFNNRLVRVYPMTRSTLMTVMTRSIQSCGSYGAMMQSGLKVEFTRDCTGRNEFQRDINAKLVKVSMIDGTELDPSTEAKPGDREFRVATLDFLLAGGSGYELGTFEKVEDLGIVREVLVEKFFSPGSVFPTAVDGRMRDLTAPQPQPQP